MIQTWRQIIAQAPGPGAAVTAAAATTLLPSSAKGTLNPQQFFYAGQMLHIWASGKISTVITTPGTARFDVRLGGTVVFDGLAALLDAAAAHTNVGWELDITLTCQAVGSAGNFMGYGSFKSEVVKGFGTAPVGVLSAILPWNSAPAVGSNVDLTVSQTVDLFFTQTVGTGSITLLQYYAELSN